MPEIVKITASAFIIATPIALWGASNEKVHRVTLPLMIVCGVSYLLAVLWS